MLELDDNSMLLDALRPPTGMQIAAAVGTTFTLDLTALLAIPVAATLDADVKEGADLLEIIRRYSDRTILFCQAGAISVPKEYRAAHTFIEQTVVEIQKPTGGIFHPKVWVVRFEGSSETVHRVLVMSRNLTFDRAWDLIVRLDEDPQHPHAVDISPLQKLLSALPSMAAREPSPAQMGLLAGLVHSLGRARLAVPAPFTAGVAVPQFVGTHSVPFLKRCNKALAVTPFLSPETARRFIETADKAVTIVSRRAGLDGAAAGLRASNATVLRVKDAVIDAQESADLVLDDPVAGVDLGTELAHPSPAMRGLHAKFYVQDISGQSTVWLGSANLTDSAYRSNVELQVALTGPTHAVGVDAFLDPKRERRDLSRLVEDHLLPEDAALPEDEDGVTPLESLAYDVASRMITVTLEQHANLDQQYVAAISISNWSDTPPGLTLGARLLSLPDYHPVVGGIAVVPAFGLTAITPFVVLELNHEKSSRQILVRADLVNDPGGRRSLVLANAIKSQDDFLRYLAALLGLGAGGLNASGGDDATFGAWGGALRSDRILEDLLTTVSRTPGRLVSLEQTLKHLDKTPETRDLVPAEFRQIWKAVYTARKQWIG